MKNVDVLILGGGIVGISLARELQVSGRRVVLLERSTPGYGCSYGNAGWITPCFAMPLPQPGMLVKSIGWLLDPESPLHIKPELSKTLALWLWRFFRAMNQQQMLKSIEVLTEISKFSLQFYRELGERTKNSIRFEQKGLLMVSATNEGLKATLNEMNLMAERGISGRQVSSREIEEMEPALKRGLKGGVYFNNEAHADPLLMVKALEEEFKAAGGTVCTGTEVFDFEIEKGKIVTVRSTRGDFKPELAVLCLGSWSRSLARKLRVNVPVLGGKGYSMIINQPQILPRHPIMVLEKKLAITPRENSVRLAGTLELVDQDESITPRRLNAILRGGETFLHLGKPEISEVWRGLRPCTPDGVPMIGFSKKISNLFYNTGHQMLGIQSAPGSARLAADIILNRTPLADTVPFRPERFE